MNRYQVNGIVQAVLIGQEAQSLVTSRLLQVQVHLEGFAGDKHSGFTRQADGRTPHYPRGLSIRNDRQVSLVAVEDLDQIAATLGIPQVLPEWLGANLLISGIPQFTHLPPRTRLIFAGGAVLIVEAENMPCTGPGKVLTDTYKQPELQSLFPKAGMHRRGLVACVEKAGLITAGDVVSAEIHEQILWGQVVE